MHASVGRFLDSVRCKVIDPSLFVSKESLVTVADGTELEAEVPRLCRSEEEFSIIQNTGTTVEVVTETSFAS